MKSRRVLRSATLLLSLLVLTAFAGCSLFNREVTPHFIEGADIYSVETGSKIISPDGTEKAVDRMGWFASDHWMKEVAKTIKEERENNL